MLRTLGPGERITTRALGDFCPYYTVRDGAVVVADAAEEIFDFLPAAERIVDPAGVAGLFMLPAIPGGLTLVQGVRRMPWRATLTGAGRIERAPPIPHGDRTATPAEIATGLIERLEAELVDALAGRRRVWLLLTGGLDSRVVAGVLKRVEPRIGAEIRCVTWGHDKSRDVAYARRIAELYEWPFQPVPYGVEETWANLELGATWGGAEVPGHHLHGMAWFRNAARDDLVLASSFGDGIGRAEFSGKHLLKLDLPPLRKRSALLHPDLAEETIDRLAEERASAWEGTGDAPLVVRVEHDRQENYMRRMICHAMDSIRRFCDLYQAFTADEVVRYMWSFAPDRRTDAVYGEALSRLDPRLSSIPWARTGTAPDGTREPDESLTMRYHWYGTWLSGPLKPRIAELAAALRPDGLGVLWDPAVERVLDRWPAPAEPPSPLVVDAVKLASLELARRRFGLEPPRAPTPLKDGLRRMSRTVKRKLAGARSRRDET